MIAHINAILRIGIGAAGLLIGYYQLFNNSPESALDVLILTTVGVAGLLSFAGHFIFHQSDALRLGRESANHFYQYEVGFAHLSFALIAFFAYFGAWGLAAKVLVVLGYTIYLLQAGILYAWRCHIEHRVFSRYFLRHGVLTLVYVGMMIYFVTEIMKTANLTLF